MKEPNKLPRPILYVGAVLVALSLVPLALLARERAGIKTQPRLQVVPDMDSQPKFKAQSANPLFRDGRAMRRPVAGTVARDEPDPDGPLASGRRDGEWLERNALPVTGALMERGRERFGIYCAPCHGLAGAGDGLVSRRADRLQEGTWTPPTDLASRAVRERADGHLFNTIGNGIRNMPAYGSQIPPADRWAVVAYVRALQRARHATLEDVPPDARDRLE